jgi:hypothetical protein
VVEIFICYRTEDEPYGAAFLDAVLSNNFGSDVVFRASKSIDPGDDFEERIFDAIRHATILLVVIGPNWLATDDTGRRRIDDPADFVRREITEALRCGVRIIPVQMNSDRLKQADLPDDVAELARIHGVRVHFRHSQVDGKALVDQLRALVPGLESTPEQPAAVNVRAHTVQSMNTGPVNVHGDFVINPASP